MIDTNAVSAHFNSDQRIVSFLEQAEQIIVPAIVVSELCAYLRKNGTPIPQNDIWIAAVAVAVGLPLLTLNDDFDRLPQVRRIAAG